MSLSLLTILLLLPFVPIMYPSCFIFLIFPCRSCVINRIVRYQGESVALEGKIRAVKDAKAETLQQILEAERQVMLWEKKTQLERETQVSQRRNY